VVGSPQFGAFDIRGAKHLDQSPVIFVSLWRRVRRALSQYTKSGNVSIAYHVIGEGPIDLVYPSGWVSNVEYAWENPY
jgi:hypothetical protein